MMFFAIADNKLLLKALQEKYPNEVKAYMDRTQGIVA